MKWTKTCIAPDLTPHQRQQGKYLLGELRRSRNEGEQNIVIRHGEIVVRKTQTLDCKGNCKSRCRMDHENSKVEDLKDSQLNEDKLILKESQLDKVEGIDASCDICLQDDQAQIPNQESGAVGGAPEVEMEELLEETVEQKQ